MLEIIDPVAGSVPSLAAYAADPRFATLVGDLRSEAEQALPRVRGRIWMVNSTATGGGVAEMLPGLVALLRDLGFGVGWAVMGSDRPEFSLFLRTLASDRAPTG